MRLSLLLAPTLALTLLILPACGSALSKSPGPAPAQAFAPAENPADPGDNPAPDQGIACQKVQELFTDWGYKASLIKNPQGAPVVVSGFNKVRFGVYFPGCTDGPCDSIQYLAGFGEPGQVPCATANAWTARHRFVQAIINQEGKLYLKLDWSMRGDAELQLKDSLEVWKYGVETLIEELSKR